MHEQTGQNQIHFLFALIFIQKVSFCWFAWKHNGYLNEMPQWAYSTEFQKICFGVKRTKVPQLLPYLEFRDPDKALFSTKKYWYFSYFSTKIQAVGTHYECLTEALLMSIQNMFLWSNRKMLCGYPLLSGALCSNTSKIILFILDDLIQGCWYLHLSYFSWNP